MRRVLAVLALWLALAGSAAAQDEVALFADALRVEQATGRIVAEGNVEAFYRGSRLTAAAIRYDRRTETLRAEGPIRLEGPDGVMILADLAELSTDFRAGLIRGARLIFDERLQIAAVEGAREDGTTNVLYRTVASSCTVCAEAPVPIWQIRARRVVHDQTARRIHFDGARFEAFGVPVLWLPYLSIPEPGVARAPGFLVPSAATSDFFGIGARLPYFVPLGRHADVTLTPFVTTGGAAILEAGYRQRIPGGGYDVFGAVAPTDGAGGAWRGFVAAQGVLALPLGVRADAQLNLASDRSFLGQFGYSDDDRLLSVARLSRQTARSRGELRIEGYQTLREDEAQSAIPLVLPQATWRRYWPGRAGTIGARGGLLGLARDNGRDVVRLDAGADWRAERVLPGGVLAAALADVSAVGWNVADDPAFTGADRWLGRVSPALGAELRWPLVRRAGRTRHVVTPFASLIGSTNLGDTEVPNEDSTLPELDENNLLTLSRFPGLDATEIGTRLNTGVGYARIAPSGWAANATIGRVFRLRDRGQFASGTGLAGTVSDYVLAASVAAPGGSFAVGRALFDEQLEFKRGELALDYAARWMDLSGSYTFLAGDPDDPQLGQVATREEIALATRYRVRRNWDVSADWRYDLAAGRAISAGGGVTYGNECIVARLGVARRFTSVNNVEPDTRISLEIELAGIGTRREGDWPERRCRARGGP